jgi:DNA-binding XRE family transcriptional regulator
VTGAQFTAWIAAMKAAGRIKTQADLAELIGLSVQSIISIKRNGCDKRTALACAALLHGLAPHA